MAKGALLAADEIQKAVGKITAVDFYQALPVVLRRIDHAGHRASSGRFRSGMNAALDCPQRREICRKD
jgi:hypothetical protein